MKLVIEKVVYGGQGLARVPAESGEHAGMRVFAPFTLPGEIVTASVTEEHRGYCVAEAQAIEQPSEHRATPPCPWFGVCGGCQLQHGTYAYQVELKRHMLAETLSRAGVTALPKIAALTADPLAYRNRVRLHVRTRPEFAIGYRQAKSHRLTAIEYCPISAPLLNSTITRLRRLGEKGMVPEDIEEVEMYTNHDESELLLTFWIRHGDGFNKESFVEFFEAMQADIPQLTGSAVVISGKEPATAPLLEWKQQYLRYLVLNREYKIQRGSFFQVNARILDTFASAVLGQETGKSAWDLYAGSGLFTLALAERFAQVVGVESSPAGYQDLRFNLRNTGASAVRATTLEFLKNHLRHPAKHRNPAPDLVLLDPPRAGAGVEVCRMLLACAPRKIVYVSCDPATLGRDLVTLIQSGYRLQRLEMADMFPQTGHLETIATLSR